MTTEWNAPLLPGEKQPDIGLQFMHRRAAGLEQLSVILDDLAERGLPICTATTGVTP